MYTVYMHITPPGKKYIGITKRSAKQRWASGNGYKSNKHFYNAITKYGWDKIQHVVLFEGLTEDAAKEKEIELISKYKTTDPNNGYNKTHGGDTSMPLCGEMNGMFGKWHTEETRKAQSEIAKQRFADKSNHPMFGTHRSEETKKRLSKSHKGICAGERNYFYGKKFTKEDHPMYGKHHSEETRRKISQARMGKGRGKSAYNSRPIRNVETGEVFSCAMEISRKHGYDNSVVGKCCKGLIKCAYGQYWEYA